MRIELIKGDITEQWVDAVVNAANTTLLGGGGVDGAIHRKGGRRILEECQAIRAKQGGCKVGEAVITTAGKLPAKFVIHTVGPRWNDGKSNEANLLKNCYINSLDLAVENNVDTIAFTNISTGIYRFPKNAAAEIAIDSVVNFPDKDKINLLQFVCFDEENYRIYSDKLKDLNS
ncbi:O-acetyl-ADP-ribose deacetylase [Parvicella tangerina]|uniref:O-acetyl-ADP-ribose deacetylase n=1 Tax=Parvicella tangerina TaxID=2829795 RepID=A0A916JJY5_9FLAO|nr:O-acetyl-ADP-ribose deacetylase [Parvicella tangerina]CAG5077550.1 O-acetyl-ADP-ribose deacetylase [Parvicella tangerina]